MQSDGKLVVAGYSDNGSNNHFALVRYNDNGSLDTSFNGTGKVSTAIGSISDYSSSVAVQTDGKILVAGYAHNANNDFGEDRFALVRYKANGSLDTSFNGTGKLTTDLSGLDYGSSVAVQRDGKIVVAGSSADNSSGNDDFALVRYNANGSLDTSFNGTGKVITDLGISFSGSLLDPLTSGRSVAVQSDGKIVVAGNVSGSNCDFALVRYNADGSLDTTFNGTGTVTTAIGSGSDIGQSVAVQSDGKIVVAGYSHNGSNYDFALARYHGTTELTVSPNTATAFGSIQKPLFAERTFTVSNIGHSTFSGSASGVRCI